jgi:hypothetical protein
MEEMKMSIMNYIADKKARFKNKIESRRTKSIASKEVRLRELEIKNKVRENDMRIERQLRAEEIKSRDMKRERQKSGLAGRIAGNIKEKYSKGKQSQNKSIAGNTGNIWTQSNTSFGDAPFSKGSFNTPLLKQRSVGRNVFSDSGEKKSTAQRKRIRIIEYR